ncbi:acyltransferase family protein [bacterium]|nr:acyltransferase family protein [bacterium]
MGITWTIALLVQSYVFIVIMVKKLNRQKLMLFFGVLIICAPLFRSIIFSLYNYVFFFCRADSLLIGGLIALLVRDDAFVSFLKKNKKGFVLLLGTFLCGSIVLVFKNHQIGNSLNHFWLALLYGMFILYPFVFEKGRINNFFKSKTLYWLGSRSYAIFLLHQIVSGLMHGLFANGKPLMYSLYTAGLTLAAFAITLVLAELSFRFLERPILKYGRSMKYERLQRR